MNDLRRQVEKLLVREHLTDEDYRQLGPRAVPILIESFETATGELDDRIRAQALLALGALGTRKAVDFLIA